MTRQLTAIIEREDDGYVALCPELDVASQGTTVSDARENLKEALELFLETASDTEIKQDCIEESKQGTWMHRIGRRKAKNHKSGKSKKIRAAQHGPSWMTSQVQELEDRNMDTG